MSTDPHGTFEASGQDRRVAVRRQEDYFWLKSLADLTGEACIVVNRSMGIDFIDDKVFSLLNIEPSRKHRFHSFSQLTRIMAERGYFGHGDPKTFEALIKDLLVNQRLKQSTATQIINAVTPSGQHIDIRVSLGRDDNYLLLMRDTTHEELKRSALETALEIGQSGYWYYNLASQEFRVRADFLEKHFTPEAFAKISEDGFRQVLHPDDNEAASGAMTEAIKLRKPSIAMVRIISDDGFMHTLKCNVMPNIDEGGRVRSLCCFFTNVSQQVQIEHDLREARSEAEAALKAKNEFLGRMSHEVRTPLNAVIGMADALVHNCKDSEILPQLTLIQNSAENVMELVDSTLEHTKLADDAVELNTRLCSPGELVTSVTRKWQNRAKANGTKLVCRINKDVPEQIEFDDYRYEQCLSNLLSNALKFAKGGKVEVVLASNIARGERQLVLAVRDNGIGIDASALSHVFLPFKQADKSITREFGGTGLGLAIVKDLVVLMGGKITLNSEPGKGTMFVMTVPMAQGIQPSRLKTSAKARTEPEAVEASSVSETPQSQIAQAEVETPEENEAPKADKPFGHLRVLIVDDNATNHIVVSSLLNNVVGSIVTALNGEEALQRLKEQPFDLVLMDIHMPVMDGIETTLAIRGEPSDYQAVPIIALTADPQYQQARLCRNIGMNSSLGKPIKLTGLLDAFEEVLLSDNADGIATAA